VRFRSDQSGFTLIEMLVACTLGLIVLTAALGLAGLAQRSTARITERADDAQRGRVAMEQMVQGLNSEVCAKPNASASLTPLVYGDDNKVVFYSDIAAPAGANASAFAPDQHTYQLNGTTLTDTPTPGVGTYPNVTFPTAQKARVIATGAGLTQGKPLFAYYTYGPDGHIDLDHALQTPLSATDIPRVTAIRITFATAPSDGSTDSRVLVAFDDLVTTSLPVTPPKAPDTNWIVSCPI
jgi:prepilin-type N-terminal cleavage/methylation domain-containing protein